MSVTDYGAKGDGRTDDAQAFQAAIDACDEVFVPYGRYVLGTTIHLRSTTTLFGELYSLLIASNTSSAFRRSVNTTAPTPLLSTPDDAAATVRLVDLTLVTMAIII